MGSGAPNLSNISITNSTFTQNGNGSENGDGDIVCRLPRECHVGEPDHQRRHQRDANDIERRLRHQISGFDPTTHNVTQPIDTVVFNNVQVNGSYDKVPAYIQAYTSLDDLDSAKTGSGGTVISGHDGWGYEL